MGTDHSASASALGYSYQTRVGLLQLVEHGPDRPDWALTLEVHDDAAWDDAGSATELLQMKHHSSSQPSVTDKSVDLWKTLKVWLDRPDAADPEGPDLRLVTTASAPEGSAASLLGRHNREETQAVLLLAEAAKTSDSSATESARSAFLCLSPADRLAFLTKIEIWDSQEDVSAVDQTLRRQLHWVLPPGQADLFMEMLWGWWDKTVLRMLSTDSSVRVGEVYDQASLIRDQFSAGGLPTVVSVQDVDGTALLRNYVDRVLVEQLKLVGCPPLNVQMAVVDYYRAYVHETRWLNDDLIATSELEDFEAALVGEWQREFEFETFNLQEDVTNAERCAIGLSLFRKLLEANSIKVRERYDDPHFARGKRQDLADRLVIGWHPDYASLLGSIAAKN